MEQLSKRQIIGYCVMIITTIVLTISSIVTVAMKIIRKPMLLWEDPWGVLIFNQDCISSVVLLVACLFVYLRHDKSTSTTCPPKALLSQKQQDISARILFVISIVVGYLFAYSFFKHITKNPENLWVVMLLLSIAATALCSWISGKELELALRFKKFLERAGV